MRASSLRVPGPPAWLMVALAALLCMPVPAEAQYFGRNKVQYENFDFHVLHTEHFNVLFYPAEERAVRDAARLAERWHSRFARVFQHTLTEQPILLYANHPDFQQTNAIQGFLSQGTGGVTEALKNRVVLPLTDSYKGTDHVLGHELVHAFQYDIAKTATSFGLRGLGRLPLWIVEGMAEYLTQGRVDVETATAIRAALLREDLPSFEELASPEYFPYDFGQAALAYIGGRYGDRAVVNLLRYGAQAGVGAALIEVTGRDPEQLTAAWHRAIRETYLPAMNGRVAPAAVGEPLLEQETDALTLGPAISPNGRYVALLSNLGLFTIDLYLVDTRTGDIDELASAPTNPHYDALSFTNIAGAWAPDGSKLAFTIIDEGDNELAILDVSEEEIIQRIEVPDVGAISGPAWSPNGRYIAFSGSSGGISDLYVLDLATGEVEQLTDDRYAAIMPEWAPSGETIVYATDRGPGTGFEQYTFAPMRLGFYDMDTGRVRTVTVFEGAKHINPEFSPDGRSLYFISDRNGFSDIYRLELETGEVFQVTQIKTGVTGITALSPALSVAERNGRLVFTVVGEDGGYEAHTLSAAEAQGEPVARTGGGVAAAAVLPPVEAAGEGFVWSYLHDPRTGLPRVAQFEVTDYDPDLALDFIGGPALGVGVSSFGTLVGGGISARFSDLLGNHLVGVTVRAQGRLRDIGGQVVYMEREGRWDLGVGAGHIPRRFIFPVRGVDEVTIGDQTGRAPFVGYVIRRIYYDQVQANAEYPLSRTRRFEFNGGYTRIGFGCNIRQFFLIGRQRVRREKDCSSQLGLDREPLHLFRGSAAYVGDYSFFAFTSPVQGGRYRFEVEPTLGTLDFVTALADYRRYLFFRPITLAVRGLHYGRYGIGSGDNDGGLRALFLGRETFIRGYSFESFNLDECRNGRRQPIARDCAASDDLNNLLGSRIGVANIELRIPLLGTERFGLINFPYLPTELIAFADAGMAGGEAVFAFGGADETVSEHQAVFSAGVGARFNILGYLVLQAYYAYPFQRDDTGWVTGFVIAPGW